MKRCSKCKEEKEFSEFCLNKKSKDGYNYSCKKCANKKINKQELLFEIDRIKNEIPSEEVINGETWKDIPNYEGYQASDLGNIRSKDRIVEQKNGHTYFQSGRVLAKTCNGAGYLSSMLSIEGRKPFRRYVHRLVAMAFLSMDENMQVDHIDSDKSNNRLNNLRVVTQRENNHYYQKSRSKVKTCEYVGVTYSKEKDLYFPTLSVGRVNYILGSYKTSEEAKMVYDKALKDWVDEGKIPYIKNKQIRKKGKVKNIVESGGKFYVVKGYRYKNYRIFSFYKKEDAVKCLQEFNKFIEDNNQIEFPIAVEEFKKLYKGE